MSAETTLQQFVKEQRRFLELELHADEDTNDATTKESDGGGFYLRNVELIDTSVGLYGRTVVSFGQTGASDSSSSNIETSRSSFLLSAHRLTVGDEIEVLPRNDKIKQSSNSKRAGGVVCAVDDYSISIALEDKKRQGNNAKRSTNNDELDEDSDMLGGSGPYTLVPRSGVEVHQKMIKALDELEKFGVNHPIAGHVISAAFEQSNGPLGADCEISSDITKELEKECNLTSTKLDFSQKEAVVFALNSKSPISLIHGPPGTGKTTTVAELIRCAVKVKNWKVLVTAPSNVAVDNVLERIMSLEDENKQKSKRKVAKNTNNQRIKAVRLGHPARIQQSIQKYSLESQVQSSDGTEIVQDCRRELNNYLKTLSNPNSRPPEKRNAYREMKSLRKEIRTREEKVVGEILRNANVVLATNVGAAGSVFRHMADSKGEPLAFDLVIIDEAAQALEASCWISLLRGKKAVLAGDHCQLPPTIKCSNRTVQTELGMTLFERLMKSYDSKNLPSNKLSKMLKVQYRMHQDIADWASQAMYDGTLISHESVKHRKLNTLPCVQMQLGTDKQVNFDEDFAHALQNVTLTLIDTTGCGFNENTTDAGSRYNEGEATLVVSHVQSLLLLGLRPEDIAVITPYNGQVELLRKMLLPDVPKLEIRSVDGFQGGEKEAVVLSLVRSSEQGGKDGIGFLSDERRLNVAVTRAKRHCAVICDCETVSQNKFIKGLINWMEAKGDYRSGAEAVSPNESCVQMQSSDRGIRSEKKSPATNKDTKNAAPIKENAYYNNAETERSAKGQSSSDSTKQDALKEGARRRALMNRISEFSESKMKGDELVLKDLSDFDVVVSRELASQLGLECNAIHDNTLTLRIVKEMRRNIVPAGIESTDETITASKFFQLDVGDSSDEEIAGTANDVTQNNLLKDLALDRQRRQSSQTETQLKKNNNGKKKRSKGQKLGGGKKESQAKNEPDDNLDDLDDMAFLDAQIEKVQTSHGRKIEAKGKGYKSIINGVLLTKQDRPEVKRTNTAASNSLQAKIKAKSEDRRVKKKGK